MRRVRWELHKICASPMLLGLLLVFVVIDVLIVVASQGELLRGQAPDFTQQQLQVDAEGLTEMYQSFVLNEYADDAVRIMGDVPNAARDMMRWKYDLLQPRVRQLAETPEGSALTVNELAYPLRTLLYGKLLQVALLQAMALAALMAAMGIDCEHSSRAEDIVYATRRGRELLRDKLCASALAALSAYGILAAVSVCAFLLCYPVGHLLHAPVSSSLNWINYWVYGWRLFITWVPFTELTYLFAHLAVGAALVCIAVLLVFAMVALIPNSYVALGVSLLLFTLPLLIGASCGRWAEQLAQISPIYLWASSRAWFSDGFYNALIPWFETATVAVWLLITGALAMIGMRRFKGVDLCA